MPALRAGGGSRPRPLGASLPPPAACGPLPMPTLGGLGAARPARLRRSGSCGGWSPPAAAQVCAPAGLASRQPLRGATQSGRKAKPPAGAASRALPPASPAPAAASVLRAAPPPLVGAFGAVRPSGPGVPGSGQPPRAGPPAALPPLGPPGVAAPPRCGVPPPSRGAASAPSGRGPCAAAILTPRVRALPALRVAALVRASRGWGAGVRRLRAGLPHRKPSDKAKTSRLRRALSDDLRCGVAQIRAMPRPDASIRRQKNPLPHAAGFLQASTCRPKSLCSKNGVNRQEAG